MKTSTLETIAGHSILETLGYVRGSAVFARRVLKNKTVGLRALEVMDSGDVAEGLAAAREDAEAKMMKAAADKGANAVIAVRVDLIDLGNQTFQAIATGTAVHVEGMKSAPSIDLPVFAMPANDSAKVLPFAPRRAAAG